MGLKFSATKTAIERVGSRANHDTDADRVPAAPWPRPGISG